MSTQFSTRDFLAEYGILIATVVVCTLFVAVFTKITMDRSRLVKRHLGRYPRGVQQVKEIEMDDKQSALMMPPDATAA
jgi:hypothetical protein